MSKQKKKRSIFKKLTDSYRLLIIDEDTFEHKLDFSLTRLNVFAVTGILALLLIAGTTMLIAYTPLREYIPGYTSTKLKKQVYELSVKLDSSEQKLRMWEKYMNSLRLALSGDIKPEELTPPSGTGTIVSVDTMDLLPSHEDSLLREEVHNKEAFRVEQKKGQIPGFIPPARGKLSRHFDMDKGHYGVDIVLPKNTPVKAVAAGRVIFAAWTPDDGNVIILMHPGDYLSVYKHNSQLLKKKGDKVSAGEVIARAGNTGERTTGPHLHFELWHKGQALDPELYLHFE